ncbi:hypothetical protein D9757_011767 [Collybiopsis confluens]|uniref:Uncharacterized protein n=1 Tax=Collybiopsis confluens TaxID=2823264 RepID=A0A8H5LPZ2_9AGAR|nr:hypothetical protein D9757_011767 [Collybiopsis confluens]
MRSLTAYVDDLETKSDPISKPGRSNRFLDPLHVRNWDSHSVCCLPGYEEDRSLTSGTPFQRHDHYYVDCVACYAGEPHFHGSPFRDCKALNYRQSLRDLAAQATSRMDAVDLDLIQLGPDRRSGKFSVFRASSRGNRGAALETTNSGGPVEVNVTKTMQIHADDGLIESEEAAGGHSIVSKPPQLHLADEIDGHSI